MPRCSGGNHRTRVEQLLGSLSAVAEAALPYRASTARDGLAGRAVPGDGTHPRVHGPPPGPFTALDTTPRPRTGPPSPTADGADPRRPRRPVGTTNSSNDRVHQELVPGAGRVPHDPPGHCGPRALPWASAEHHGPGAAASSTSSLVAVGTPGIGLRPLAEPRAARFAPGGHLNAGSVHDGGGVDRVGVRHELPVVGLRQRLRRRQRHHAPPTSPTLWASQLPGLLLAIGRGLFTAVIDPSGWIGFLDKPIEHDASVAAGVWFPFLSLALLVVAVVTLVWVVRVGRCVGPHGPVPGHLGGRVPGRERETADSGIQTAGGLRNGCRPTGWARHADTEGSARAGAAAMDATWDTINRSTGCTLLAGRRVRRPDSHPAAAFRPTHFTWWSTRTTR